MFYKASREAVKVNQLSLHWVQEASLLAGSGYHLRSKKFKNSWSYDFTTLLDGFGGLVVSMLASGTQVSGFKPGRSRWIFTGVKILSVPSSGGEVK